MFLAPPCRLTYCTCSTRLRRLRVVNKFWHDVTTPQVFRNVQVLPSLSSATKLANILQADHIALHVRQIVYRHEWRPKVANDGDIPDDAIDALAAAFALAHSGRAPALSAIRLLFYRFYLEPPVGDDFKPSCRLRVQHAILSALASTSSRLALRSLTIFNLLAHTSPLFDEPAFTAIIAPLRALCVEVLSDVETESKYLEDYYSKFWEVTMQQRLLPPADKDSPLGALTIRSSDAVGLKPTFSFAGRTYPRLTVLSLKRILFHPTVDTEEFILRHAGTLKQLELEECRIALDEGEEEPSRFWAEIWNKFAETLTALEVLTVREVRDDETDQLLRYAAFDPEWGYTPIYEGVEGEEGDESALQAFADIVKTRRVGGVKR